MDDFPTHLRDVVNTHWEQFPPQHPLFSAVAGICFLLLTSISLMANYMIINVYMSNKNMKTPANFFLLNLAVSDFCMFLAQGPMMYINAFTSR